MKDQIRKILDKGKSEEYSNQDINEMYAIFHQPRKEYEIKDKLLEDLMSEMIDANEPNDLNNLFDKTWGVILGKRKKKNNNLRFLNNISKIASAIIVGLLLGLFINSLKKEKPDLIDYTTMTPKGSISQIVLPDSSIIFLNADSRIKYSLKGKKGIREVFLEGEAWFDVQRNEEKPFLVHTPYYDVNVIGTQFNIKAYESDNTMVTTLEEGKIVLQSTDKFKLGEDVVIVQGEQVVLRKDSKELTIKKVNTKWFTSWKENRLIFVNMNLRDLVILLERKYGVEIEVRNKEILDLHFDGTIKNESITEFLDIIQNTLPIHYDIVGQKIEITKQK